MPASASSNRPIRLDTTRRAWDTTCAVRRAEVPEQQRDGLLAALAPLEDGDALSQMIFEGAGVGVVGAVGGWWWHQLTARDCC